MGRRGVLLNSLKPAACGIAVLMFVSILSPAQTQKPVGPVDWGKLAPFLKEFDGWKGGRVEGQFLPIGDWKVSQVERIYRSGRSQMRITITDGAYVRTVYAGIKSAMQFEIDNSTQYLKKVLLQGYPGVDKFQYEEKQGEIIVLISNRFIVHLEGTRIEGTGRLKEVLKEIDLRAVESLEKVPKKRAPVFPPR